MATDHCSQTDEELLSQCGLAHIEPPWMTFFTAITFHEGQSQHTLCHHINDKMKKTMPDYFQTGRERIRVLMVATTFGDADAMLVWQALDWDAAKAFRDDSIKDIGDSRTLVASVSDGWRH